MPLRCIIVDDNADFCRAARHLLEREGIEVVGAASTIAEALARDRELRPDVTLVDVHLGDESGFDLARRLSSPAILISVSCESGFAELIASSPAVGFITKPDLGAEAIRAMLSSGPRDS